MKIHIDDFKKGMVPGDKGVYFIFKDEEVIYIGSSWKLNVRIGDPLNLFKRFFIYGFTHIQWFVLDWNYRYIEAELISTFKPILNQRLLSNPY